MLDMILYAALTGVVVALEHFTFGRWWARNELARRTMGHATILFLALLFVPSGLIDFTTLAAIAIATGTAGAITAALYVNENERTRRQRAASMRQRVDQYDATTR
ncbi:MAG: hypothetical protein KBE23_03320 [Chloroflexi bacterium]|nr:hypothetical protein [Chloroflexota bacterium]MBP7041743.1 hypothetical protein [Chloroflexota bacterium]